MRTHRRQLIHDSPQSAEKIIASLPALISVYNINTGEYLYVSDAIHTILGYTADEFVTGGIAFVSSLMHPDDRSSVMKKNVQALKKANEKKAAKKDGAPIVQFEYRMRRKDGTWCWLKTDGMVFDRGEDGKVLHVINISIDITERKEAEEDLTITNKRLHDLDVSLQEKITERTEELSLSEKRFRALIENSKDGITILSATGKILYSSPSAVRMFGYDYADLGKLDSFSFVHPDDRAKVMKAFFMIATHPRKHIAMTYRVRHANGTYRWIEGSAINLLKDPSIHGIVTNFRDITMRSTIQKRQEVLDIITAKLFKSVDHMISLQEITDIIVPYLADYCRVVVINQNKEIEEIAIKHKDSKKITAVKTLYDSYINNPETSHGLMKIIQSGKAEMIPVINSEFMEAYKDNKQLFNVIKTLNLTSYMGVPLIARGNIIGAITFSSTDPSVHYTEDDLHFVEEVARRIALTLDNARLYENAQSEISHRRRIEEQLRSHQERLELAQSTALVGTFEWDMIDDILYWSPELEKIYGIGKGGFHGTFREFLHLIYYEDRPIVSKNIEKNIFNREPLETEFRIQRPDGSVRWILSKSKITFDKNGRPLRTVGMNLDITERKNIENNIRFLAEASKALARSLNLEDTLQSITRLVVPLIADWCVVHVVQESGEIVRLKTTYAHAKKATIAREFDNKHKITNQSDISHYMRTVLKSKRARLVTHVTERWFTEAARSPKHYALLKKLNPTSHMLVPLLSGTRIVGIISFARMDKRERFSITDLTFAQEFAHRVALAIQNAQLYKASQDAIALRDDFISVASHELRTPVTSLKIYTQVLHRRFSQDENTSTSLTKMNAQVNKLTLLISDLLNVSKIQSGRLEFTEENFDLNETVAEVVDAVQATEEDHVILIKGKANGLIRGDKERIAQVVTNLLTNAIKYSPESKQVIIRLTNKKDKVTLCVRDFGIGIDKEHQNKIFKQFYRVSSPEEKTFPGLGIGLYISSEIVRRHGSFITVKSEKGKGSEFSFSLPFA